jgi:SAM-dependent methyltransferase
VSKEAPTVHEVFLASGKSMEEQYGLERRFFARVALTNGTFKTTYPNRLDDINEAFYPYLVGYADRPIRIMDVGASSGISTIEWYAYLSRSGIDCDITGSDVMIYGSLLTFRFTSTIAALVDSKGKIVHFDLFGTGYSRQPSRKLLRPNTLRTFAAKALFRVAMIIDGNLPPVKAGRTTRGRGFLLKNQPITLLSRGFENNDRLRMIEDDLCAENQAALCRAFDVIRVANVLNLVYFPVDQIARMLATLKQRLKENGLLIIVRTHPSGENNASIFRLASSQFVLVDRFGKGSEIEHIVTGR